MAPVRDTVVPTLRPEPAYEELFPHYIELCAATQYRPRAGAMGGAAGHAVMYLKGICRDETASYPTLARCRAENTDPYDENHGVGISVNQVFKNVNWVAIPGKRLFLHGNLGAGERLTRERYDVVLQEAVEARIFRGIEIHDRFLPHAPAGRSLDEIVAAESIGTDFALLFARTIFCARLPLTEPQLEQVMAYLNGLNEEYASGEADYNWSGYHDNCVHTLRNALAAAEVWSPKSVRAVKLRQLFNLAIPSNEVVTLMSLAHDEPLEDFGRIYGNDVQRTSLQEFDWLPMRHGALFKTLPIHQENDLFDTRFRLFVLERPFRPGATRKVQETIADPRFTDLDANLQYYRDRYEKILDSREAGRSPLFVRESYLVAEENYYRYIERQRTEVERMLRDLKGASR